MYRTIIGLFLLTSSFATHAISRCQQIPNVWTDKGWTRSICRGTYLGFQPSYNGSCSSFSFTERKICNIIRTGLAPNKNSCLVYLRDGIWKDWRRINEKVIATFELIRYHTLFSYRFCRGVKAMSAENGEVLGRLQRPRFSQVWVPYKSVSINDINDAGILWDDVGLQLRENSKHELTKIKHAYIAADEFLKLFIQSFNLSWENDTTKITMGNPIKYAIRAGIYDVPFTNFLANFEPDKRAAIYTTWQQASDLFFPQATSTEIPLALSVEEPSAPPWSGEKNSEIDENLFEIL